MDLSYSADYEAFREEVKTFLAESWPLRGAAADTSPTEQASQLRQLAIERGYVARAIPRRFGGSEQEPDVLKATIIAEEFARARAPGEVRGIGPSMLVPTLVEHGADWQRDQFIRPTILGEMRWCQGYSEPGAGSDLASLRTRGELIDGQWVINGQKIWTTQGHQADWMFCLVRTEPDAGKHAGISYLLIDMKTPGIEVRPLKQMNGTADFNEVFLTDVRVPERNIVGKRGEGWQVSRSTLKHERALIGDAAQSRMIFKGIVGLAKNAQRNGKPATEDPAIRQRLAALEGYVLSHTYSGYRQLTLAHRKQDPGLAPMLNKLTSTNIGHEVAKLALDLLGDDGLLSPGDREPGRTPRSSDSWLTQYMWSLGIAVAGGTANIQRNIIGERGLGLPRDAHAQGSSRK